ncbi:asparagine synthase-related protein [Enterococcus avium]|uniref:asparagine synthase-related protein n=1 Tax=Enterococcus avium TaxID=33945 RepID=UPI003462F09F
MIDKKYCMNSYLTYRYIVDENKSFSDEIIPHYYNSSSKRIEVLDSGDTLENIKRTINDTFSSKGSTALMLSGGIDSAILARLVPKGTKAFTFQPDLQESVSEVEIAREVAKMNELDHEVIKISWDDYDSSIDSLMTQKGAPIHSIEPQIYKAASVAKNMGYEKLLFGEAADAVFGGLSGLLSKDYTIEEFYKRYSFVDSELVLKDFQKIISPIKAYETNSEVDVHGFLNEVFFKESNSSYENACNLAGIEFISPFNKLIMKKPLDLERVRNGENKYILREIYNDLYPGVTPRPKLPMPRPVNEFFKNWGGPTRDEFRSDIEITNFTGDQKWMIYCLERFLNLFNL